MKKITVVMPALNEEQGIGLVLKEIPVGKLMNMGYETEVMVVDNGSKDKTCYVARQHGAMVIIQPIRGYGNAYKAGFANASGDIIATGDADFTYPFEDLPEIIEKMEKEDLDFINTNRLQHVNPEVMSSSHVFGNKLLTTITKILFNLPFVDSQSGMWVFRREIWDELDVRSAGMSFSQELKIEVYIRGFKCAEVPIKYRIRAGVAKLNTLKDGTKVMFRIFHKRLSTLFLKNTIRRKERVSILEETSCAAGAPLRMEARLTEETSCAARRTNVQDHGKRWSEDTNGEPYFHAHIDEKNVFELNSAEGLTTSTLGDESWVQVHQSLPEREVSS